MRGQKNRGAWSTQGSTLFHQELDSHVIRTFGLGVGQTHLLALPLAVPAFGHIKHLASVSPSLPREKSSICTIGSL